MRRLLPNLLLPALAACAIVALLGCDGGLDLDNANLPAPSIALGPPPATCASAGSGTISFGIQDITVIENFSGSAPQNRVDVSGTVSGLGMGDELDIVLLPFDGGCPLLGSDTATHDGATFSARIGFGERTAFRVALIAHAGGLADLDCPTGGDCLTTAAGSFTAVSDSIEVLLQ